MRLRLYNVQNVIVFIVSQRLLAVSRCKNNTLARATGD